MNKIGRVDNIIKEGMVGIVGIFAIYLIAKSLCQADSQFCYYGWTIFSAVFVGLCLVLKNK